MDPLDRARDRAQKQNQYTIYQDDNMHVYHSDNHYAMDIYQSGDNIITGYTLTNKEFKELANKLFIESRKIP